MLTKWSRVVFLEYWRVIESIYLFLSVDKKMTPFPETVSDPPSLGYKTMDR